MIENVGGFVLLKGRQEFNTYIVMNQKLKVIKEDHGQVIESPVCAPMKLYISFRRWTREGALK